ncbi:MAG: SRPBCC family protein, partial [Armatimonadota bacterium]
PSDAVRALRPNLPRLADAIDDIEQIEIVEEEGNRTVSRWSGRAQTPFGGPIRFQWTEEGAWDEAGGTYTVRQTEGDFDEYRGTWAFAPSGDGCELTLGIEFAKEIGGLGPVVENLLQSRLQSMADALVRAAKQLAEG